MGVTDVARQHAQVPVGLLWQREEEVGFRAAGAERCDAAVSGPEELARVAERVPERLVRLANIFQMSGQALYEFERGELALYRQHGGSLPPEIDVDARAAAAERFRVAFARSHVEPGLTTRFGAPELQQEGLERFYDRLEFRF